jgi:hypothetical protein
MNKSYTFTPLLFFGRRYDVTWKQSAIIGIATVLSILSQFVFKDHPLNIIYRASGEIQAVFFWAFWALESVKNHLIVFILRIK